jgi:hypothetical protein
MATMRVIGDRMCLGEEPRITLIQLQRSAIDDYRRILPRDVGEDGRLTGALFVDQLEIFPEEDLASIAARLIVHMPACIAIIGGTRREGYQWLGVCQIFAVEHRPESARRASRISLTQALESIGLDIPMRRSPTRMTEGMRAGYWVESEANAEDWGIDLLTLGGVVEMAGQSLGQLVQDSKRGAPKPRTADGWIARSQYIEDRLIEMLVGWVEKGGRLAW